MKILAQLFLFLTFLASNITYINAQAKGKIIGQVSDSKESIIGANVVIKGTQTGSTTDIDGNFSIEVASGTYSLVITYVGYKTKEISNITVTEGQSITTNATLEEEGQIFKEVVITASVTDMKRENIDQLQKLKKNSSVISDFISAESIRRSPDRDAGSALKRVSGVSIQDNRFIVVRGMMDRYCLAMANGSILPSTEPDRKSFSFDLFPASLIDNITINKAPTPDLPAEFAGGLIQITTKDIPNENFMSLSLSGGYNTASTFKPYTSFAAGKTDFLGIDDGSRAIPTAMADRNVYQNLHNTDKIALSKTIPNNWGLQTHAATPMNMGAQWTAGFTKNIKSSTLGGIAAVTYNNSYRMDIAERKEYNFDRSQIFNYTDDQFRNNVLWGAMFNVGYKIDDNHKITLRNSFNVNASNQTILRIGRDNESNNLVEGSLANFTANQLLATQLAGNHYMPLSKVKVNWLFGYNDVQRSTPDLRKMLYQKSADPTNVYPQEAYVPAGSASPNYAGKFYSNLQEKVYSTNADVSKTFQLFDKKQVVKVGGFLQQKNRDFVARVLGFVINNPSKFRDNILTLPQDKIFAPENIGADGFRLDEITGNSDKYDANSLLSAGFVSLDNQFSDKIRAVWGVRYEQFNQNLHSAFSTKPVYVKNNFGALLPSLNLTYSINDKTNIRASASRTVSRPEFRELAPFAFYDFERYSFIIGNQNLTATKINNYDLRYEWFPGGGQVISSSVFYKNFINPIEPVFFATGVGTFTRSFQNAKSANTYGVEVEWRKTFDFINEKWANVTFFGNTALIQSKVDLGNVAGTASRPLQGQSPYLINTGLQYLLDSDKGISATVLYNRIGRRIDEVGDQGYPNIWEKHRDLIDVQMSAKVLKNGEIRFTASDILRQAVVFYQDIDNNGRYMVDKDNTITKVRLGTTLGLSFNYKFK
jgi:outer membrane receptor protein involved in Fe transport